ncbi:hypothetical protein NB717_001678 [Xanthomonas sacchari]|nr:hypothetical protein [Xanthomonas sacchari]
MLRGIGARRVQLLPMPVGDDRRRCQFGLHPGQRRRAGTGQRQQAQIAHFAADGDAQLLQPVPLVAEVDQGRIGHQHLPVAQIVAALDAVARLLWLRSGGPLQRQRAQRRMQRAGIDQPAGSARVGASAGHAGLDAAHTAVAVALGDQLQIRGPPVGRRRQRKPRQRLPARRRLGLLGGEQGRRQRVAGRVEHLHVAQRGALRAAVDRIVELHAIGAGIGVLQGQRPLLGVVVALAGGERAQRQPDQQQRKQRTSDHGMASSAGSAARGGAGAR